MKRFLQRVLLPVSVRESWRKLFPLILFLLMGTSWQLRAVNFQEGKIYTITYNDGGVMKYLGVGLSPVNGRESAVTGVVTFSGQTYTYQVQVQWKYTGGKLVSMASPRNGSDQYLRISGSSLTLSTTSGTTWGTNGLNGSRYLGYSGGSFTTVTGSSNITEAAVIHQSMVPDGVYQIYCDHAPEYNKGDLDRVGLKWYLDGALIGASSNGSATPASTTQWQFIKLTNGNWQVYSVALDKYLGMKPSGSNFDLSSAPSDDDELFQWSVSDETTPGNDEWERRFYFTNVGRGRAIVHYSDGSNFALTTSIGYSLRIALCKEAGLEFGFYPYPTIPGQPIELVRTLRISKEDVNNSAGIQIPVYNWTGSPTTGVANVALAGTDDTRFPLVSGEYPAFVEPTGSYTNGDKYVHLTQKSSQDLLEGHYYLLRFNFINSNPLYISRVSRYLKVIVVPKYLTWNPAGNTDALERSSWNNDDNWKYSESADWGGGDAPADLASRRTVNTPSGNPGRGYVPLASSYVTLPTGQPAYPVLVNPSNTISPILYKNVTFRTLDPFTLEAGCTPNISYDIYFEANTNNSIHFEPATALVKQNYLNYNKAWVELQLKASRWYMLSSPFPRTVSGDFHLLHSGVDTRAPFADLSGIDPAAGRIAPAVYQKAWENSVTNVSIFGPDQSFAFTSSKWITPHNFLSEDFKPGSGFAIWADNSANKDGSNNEKDVVFRFPKTDASYAYYTDYGAPTGRNEAINRGNERGEIFQLTPLNSVSSVNITKSATGSYIFLLGNPFMSHLGMANFLSENSSRIQPKFWVETSDGLATMIVKPDGTMDSSTGQAFLRLAPMQSFFVESKTTGSALNAIAFTEDMMVADSYTGTTPDNPLRAPLRMSDEPVLRIRAQRDGVGSTMAIYQRGDASDAYDVLEDAKVLMDDRLPNRPTIYSITDGEALMIDVRRNVNKIPLGIYSDSESSVTLSFTGVESFEGVSLYDAVNGTVTPITSSDVTVQVNGSNAGRYYLDMNRTPTALDETGIDNLQAYSAAAGILTVASSNNDPIRSVEIYSPSGVLVNQLQEADSDLLTFNLAKGNYMVRVKSRDVSKAFKVIVK